MLQLTAQREVHLLGRQVHGKVLVRIALTGIILQLLLCVVGGAVGETV